jgi:hypothetical protein
MLGVLPQLFRHRVSIRPLAIPLLIALALAPVAFVATCVVSAVRDVAYWDELDTAVQLVVQLDSGIGWREFGERLFAVSNEHRMVTSRLLFATSYWLTGTVDFAVISMVGNASFVALCGLLLYSVETTARRIKLGVVLGLMMFQLQHYENFLWAGASIDHFQVVFLAGAAVLGIANGTRTGLAIAAACALLATFTLAHGIVTWLIGAGMLGRERRFRSLLAWGGFGALALAVFFAGFHLNNAQRFAEISFKGAASIAHYWVSLLGAAPAMGHADYSAWLGAGLLLGMVWLALHGATRREKVVFPLACFAVAALGLIALGRAAESGGVIHSRYYVLSALAWGLGAFMAIERLSHPRRPYAVLASCTPLLVVFNLSANQMFASRADSWIECRDRAALRFKEHGVDGRGVFALYPIPARATQLLNEAEERGVYRMATICEEREFPDAQPSDRITYYVEDVAVTGRSASVGGWAAIPGLRSRRGQIHVILRSEEETHVFTAVSITRPDVATALKNPENALSGFRFTRRRDRLPTGEFQIGFLIKNRGHTEYIMTGHRVRLVGEGKALLASAD